MAQCRAWQNLQRLFIIAGTPHPNEQFIQQLQLAHVSIITMGHDVDQA